MRRFLEIGGAEKPWPAATHIVDLETRIRGRAKTHGPDARFVAGNWGRAKLPFRDRFFYVVYTSHVLEHMHWAEEVPRAIRDAFRVLRPGGVFEVWVPNGEEAMNRYFSREITRPIRVKGNQADEFVNWQRLQCLLYAGNWHKYPGHQTFFTPCGLQTLLAQAGFKDIRLLEPHEKRTQHRDWVDLGVRGVRPCASS